MKIQKNLVALVATVSLACGGMFIPAAAENAPDAPVAVADAAPPADSAPEVVEPAVADETVQDSPVDAPVDEPPVMMEDAPPVLDAPAPGEEPVPVEEAPAPNPDETVVDDAPVEDTAVPAPEQPVEGVTAPQPETPAAAEKDTTTPEAATETPTTTKSPTDGKVPADYIWEYERVSLLQQLPTAWVSAGQKFVVRHALRFGPTSHSEVEACWQDYIDNFDDYYSDVNGDWRYKDSGLTPCPRHEITFFDFLASLILSLVEGIAAPINEYGLSAPLTEVNGILSSPSSNAGNGSSK